MIMYPIKMHYKIEGQKSLLENEEKEEPKDIEYLSYRSTYVFDISQTTGKPIPMENQRLNDNTKEELYIFLKTFSKYPVLEEKIYGGALGYWNPKDKQIVIKQELSVDDKVSVLLHEMTHSLYDDFDYKQNRDLSEIFVESVAFIVADYFNLDTSMCSFNYIAKWAKGDMKPILELGSKIQKTAKDFIKNIESQLNNDNLKIVA